MEAARVPVEKGGIVRFYNLLPPGGGFLEDVLQGLSAKEKAVPARYLRSLLADPMFARVCELPGYYAMRAELGILRENAKAIAQLLGPNSQLIEFGGGGDARSRVLIDAAQPSLYVPIEADEERLRAFGTRLAGDYPALNITGLIADYARGLALPQFTGVVLRKKAVFFPGSEVGRFTPFEAQAFLAMTRRMVGPGGVLLIGVDLKKDWNILSAACEDATGVISAYHLNLLERMNRDLGADFQPRRFKYGATYNDAHGWVETRIESEYSQFVRIAGQRFDFRAGESMQTGIACKYSVPEFQEVTRAAHFNCDKVWTDPHNLFAVFGLVAE
jgi:dimethylhistidine N-methyltransferase